MHYFVHKHTLQYELILDHWSFERQIGLLWDQRSSEETEFQEDRHKFTSETESFKSILDNMLKSGQSEEGSE